MIRADIACVAAHTNLDAAVGGVNDALAERLGVEAVTPLEAGEHGATYGIGRIGQLATAMSAEEFVLHVKKSLKLSNLRTCGDGRRQVERVAVVGGAGGSFVQIAANLGADVLVTGDVDYHD